MFPNNRGGGDTIMDEVVVTGITTAAFDGYP